MTNFKKIICIDFDGVLHSYKSGWKGPDEIPDPPVPGAIDWLDGICDSDMIPAIYSARSQHESGRSAMRAWLFKNGLPLKQLDKVKFPIKKPSAWLTIDDRAICFTGEFPTIKEIEDFKPWYYR